MRFIDLEEQYNRLKSEIDENISKVIRSTQFIGGEFVTELEEKLAEYTGRKHCITCGNGTDALQAAYMALGIGDGDAVFCTDITFISSTEPAYMLGATPIFCDIDPKTYNMSADSLEKQIKAVIAEGKLKPACVVIVDILGQPADYDKLLPICEKYNLKVIEDAAQSFGATYKGKKAASFGHIATTSFFPVKPLGCYGDGGGIFTDDEELAKQLRSICVHGKGSRGKYDNVRVGMNSRLDNIQAAVLLPKLKVLDDEMELREQVAKRYNKAFSGKLKTPYILENCTSAYAQYALLAESKAQRDSIVAGLKEKGVPSMIYYPTPQHALPVFSQLNSYGEEYKNANEYCDLTFSLPMYPYLAEEEQNVIINAVLAANI